MAKVCKDKIVAACDEVRSDKNDVTWVTFKYDGKNIVKDQTGTEFEQLYDVLIQTRKLIQQEETVKPVIFEPTKEYSRNYLNSLAAFCTKQSDNGVAIIYHKKKLEIHLRTYSLTGERFYVYVRFQTGDELSIRSKFAFITYIGENVSALKRGIMSTDKAVLKAGGLTEFAKEFHFEGDAREHIHYDELLADVKKVGGANYDAQKN